MATQVRLPATTYQVTDGDGSVMQPATVLTTITTTGDGYFEDFVTTSTSYATVSFGSVSDPEFIVIRNEDATNDVIVAVGTASNEEDCARLPPGAKWETWLPASQTVRIKSSASTPRARVIAVSR